MNLWRFFDWLNEMPTGRLVAGILVVTVALCWILVELLT